MVTDKIVATEQHEGNVLIFMESGKIILMKRTPRISSPEFVLIADLRKVILGVV